MKLAVYGVSRAGKDYFIERLIKYFSDRGHSLYHIKGAETLNRLAVDIYGVGFKQCNEAQKNKLRKQFTVRVTQTEKRFENVVVDGHYSFYNADNELDVVFTPCDKRCYDKYFYLESNPSTIVERMRESAGSKYNGEITCEQVDYWQNFEINRLTEALLSRQKELHIIQYGDLAFQYVFDCATADKYDSAGIARNFVDDLELTNDCVVLTDCDNTLSTNDSSALALKFRQEANSELKAIFKGDRYSNFQMKRAYEYSAKADLYNEESIDYIVNNILPNKELIDNLLALENVSVIGVTAGNKALWKKILRRFGLRIPLLAHEQMIVSKYVKYFIVKELQARGKYVIALGDSLLDALMLRQANKSYLITIKGHRDYLENFLAENTYIHQLAYLPRCYSAVPCEKSISAIKVLSPDENKEEISICQSASGIVGKVLRKTHYRLGKKVARLILADFGEGEKVVVSMLRSGVPFSFGIADYFDCPLLFYDETHPDGFEKQLLEYPRLKNATMILCDAVINSGKTIKNITKVLSDKKCIVATTVLSDTFNLMYNTPIYAVRISQHSYVGARQSEIVNGKGPDTSDRLYNLLDK